jgi:glycosyltransferase involved in cell wall biosynthesis
VAALKAADILLVNEKPGVAEMSIPSKLTSYFQSGTPVLAATSPESNAALEVRDSKAGIVVDGGDPERLVQAAVSLGRDEDLRKKLGANGIEHAGAQPSETASIEKFDHWIKSMLAAQRIRGSGDTAGAQNFQFTQTGHGVA